MHRLLPSSMRKESELAWAGRLRSAKSSGSAMPITSLLDVQNVRKPPQPGSGEMAAIRHERPLNRSEEHTSELQSHLNLVCRLLLEKKNRKSCETMYPPLACD